MEQYSGKRCLVMQYIDGIKINEIEKLKDIYGE